MAKWPPDRTRVLWFDVAPYSNNCGDRFTTASIERHVMPLIPHEIRRVPTHRRRSLQQQLWSAHALLAIIGGSNILSSHMERQKLLQLTRLETLLLQRRLVLCGVGWWSYESEPSRWSKNWFRRMLRPPDAVHSVRDEYTAQKLRALGYEVINTGCPTTWSLPDTLAPNYEACGAVVTVTDYAPSLGQDVSWLRAVRARYDDVTCVAQGPGDLHYIAHHAAAIGIRCKGGGLPALREELAKGKDYIGTRLHSGIFALELGARALILAIDNRAFEMAGDLHLPHMARSIAAAEGLPPLESLYPLELRIPRENILRWKEQVVDLLTHRS